MTIFITISIYYILIQKKATDPNIFASSGRGQRRPAHTHAHAHKHKAKLNSRSAACNTSSPENSSQGKHTHITDADAAGEARGGQLASITAATQRLFSPLYPQFLHLYCSLFVLTRAPGIPTPTSRPTWLRFFLRSGIRHGGDGAAWTPSILLLPRHQTVAQRAAACPR